MPDEIERKFLVSGDAWREGAHATPYTQGYISRDPERVVRIRRAGKKAYVTIKGLTNGVSRKEYEYAIPIEDAEELFSLCTGPLIQKTRHVIIHAGKKWEVDEFHGDNEGLIVAEIELKSEDEPFDPPAWLGREVSTERKYSNSNLSERPFRSWPKS